MNAAVAAASRSDDHQSKADCMTEPTPRVATRDASLTEEANDVLYKAIMQHKRMEQQRATSMMSDTKTITEAILRKQAEAKNARSVVAACTQYATNAKYVEINSGKHPRIRVFRGMHALSPDEVDVFSSLVEGCPSACVTVMHNHCMSEQGMIEGFRFTLDAAANNSYLPLNRRMFFRHSMVECYPSPGPSGSSTGVRGAQSSHTSYSCEDHTILNLLLKQCELRATLVSFMKELHERSQNGKDADFDCMPMNMDVMDPAMAAAEMQGGSGSMSAYVSSFHSRRTADCKHWEPDMPELIGLYHAYVRGFNKDTMIHKLFIVVSGGCSNLSDKFYNCSVDIRGSSMTVSDVLESEEAYYLRRINGRSNARILKMLADRLGLAVPWTTDACSYDPARPYKIATCTTETMINDMHRQRDGKVTVMVKCVDTTRVENGVLCCMHPAEGFWLFKGKLRQNTAMKLYGSFFGDEARQTSMPSCMNRMHSNYLWCSKTVGGVCEVCDRTAACTVLNRATPHIAKVDRSGSLVASSMDMSPMEAAIVAAGGRIPAATGTNACSDYGGTFAPASPVFHAGAGDRLMMPAVHEDAESVCTAPANTKSNNNNGAARAMPSSLTTRRFLAASNGVASSSYAPSSCSGAQNPRLHASPSSSSSYLYSAGDAAELYTFIDEVYLQRLQEDMNWDRDNGIIHMMPIAVVCQEDVY